MAVLFHYSGAFFDIRIAMSVSGKGYEDGIKRLRKTKGMNRVWIFVDFVVEITLVGSVIDGIAAYYDNVS